MLKNKIEALENKIKQLNTEAEDKDKKYEELVKDVCIQFNLIIFYKIINFKYLIQIKLIFKL